MRGPISALLLEFMAEDGTIWTHTATRACLIGRGERISYKPVDGGDFISLPDSRLSRPHCIFAPANGGWVIEDAGSQLGTRMFAPAGVQGPPRLLLGQAPVVKGMEFLIGRTRVRAIPQ